jgi:hypothetical protein
MRARVLLALTGVLFAIVAVPASRAEEAADAAPPKQPAAGQAAAKAPTARARGRSDQTREQWWAHAREVLVGDLALTDDQAGQIDAIIERQIAARKRVGEIQTGLRDARRDGDAERGAALRAQLGAARAELKDPAVRIEEMRALLTEEQRPAFDMNRARLVAESQQARETQRRRPPRRAGPGADAPAKTE